MGWFNLQVCQATDSDYWSVASLWRSVGAAANMALRHPDDPWKLSPCRLGTV